MSSHGHLPEAVVGNAPPQTSIVSLSLEQLMDRGVLHNGRNMTTHNCIVCSQS